MTKEEIENLIRKIIKEELYCHLKMWHLGISDEK
jgi:hypothetical protein